MSHALHDGPEAVFYDNCDECNSRAREGIGGLLHLDHDRLLELVEVMNAVEYRRGRLAATTRSYRSGNEALAGRQLFYLSLLFERAPGPMLSLVSP